ncbi:MAG: MFS transporter [Gordonibacter sp.]
MAYTVLQHPESNERRERGEIMEHAASNTTAVNLSKGRRWASLVVLAGSLLVITMDMTILNVALPQITAELKPTGEQLLWMVDVYSLALAGLLVTMSSLGDRFGRKKMLVIGYLIFGIGSVSAFFANSPEFVIALRALLGVGGAMIMPTTLSLLRSVFPDPKERATAISVWAAISAIGAAIGPLVGGFLLEHFSWHAAFLVNVPIMVFAVLGSAFVLPEVKVKNPGPWDFVGAALSIGGMVLVPWAIKRFAQEMTFSDPTAIGAIVAGVVLLVLFIRRCLRRPDPLLDISLFKLRPFAGGIIAALGALFGLAAMMLLLAQWMQLVHNFSPMETGVRMLPFAVMGLMSSLAAPWLARKIGTRTTIALGLLVAAAGMAVVWFNRDHLDFSHVFACMVLIGLSQGSFTVASAMIMSTTPPEKAGNAAAIEETSYELGNLLGVAIVGSLAALAYKIGFDANAAAGLPAELASTARESLGAALEIANQAGLPEMAQQATLAFNASLADASAIGAVVLALAAVAVFFVIPKNTDIDKQAH